MNVMSLMPTLDGLVDELGLQHVLCQCIRSGGGGHGCRETRVATTDVARWCVDTTRHIRRLDFGMDPM
eukprot:m.469126 g.469126  ORF g.469126 m.469126 type:complete len:68 (+) comp299293_c0_seq1:2-205(+)